MIVISTFLKKTLESLDGILKQKMHYHDFKKELDFSVWKPKVIMLSTETVDLLSLSSVNEYDAVKVLFLRESDRDKPLMVGQSIDYILSVIDKPSIKREVIQIKDNDELVQELQKFQRSHALKSNFIYIIAASYRPGVATFVTFLEHIYVGLKNSEEMFDIFTVQFAGAKYIIVGVSRDHSEKCIRLANKLKLRMKSGKPVVNGTQHFPFSHSEDSTFTLENTDHSDIPNDPKKLREKLRKEQFEMMMFSQSRKI